MVTDSWELHLRGATQSNNYWTSTSRPGTFTNAMNVNFNNGNANNNTKTNSNFVRCVRALPPPAPSVFHIFMSTIFTLEKLYKAYKDCREGKKNTVNAILFEVDREKNLILLLSELQNGTYKISRSIYFIVTNPVAREIFAADFRDRIVHHLLYNEIQAIFEDDFIHGSYANREGKGTHTAVAQLRKNIREVKSKSGNGYYLKLDIENFFRSINREILYSMVEKKIQDFSQGDSVGSVGGGGTLKGDSYARQKNNFS